MKQENNFFLFGYNSGDPDLEEFSNMEECCKKISGLKIYHAVPKEYNNAFNSGLIVLGSASEIRKYEDEQEGRGFTGSAQPANGPNIHTYREDDFYLFSMSLTKNIREIRQQRGDERILYEVNLSNFLSVLENMYKKKNLHLCFNEKNDEQKRLFVYSAWVQIINYSKYYNCIGLDGPPVSEKSTNFKDEREIRLSFIISYELNDYISTQLKGEIAKNPIAFNLPKAEWNKIFKIIA